MNRIIVCILLFLVCFGLSSCAEDTTSLAKSEFEQFGSKNDVVLIIDDRNLYFDEYTVKLEDLINGEEPIGCIITDKIYFATSKENGMFNFNLLFYKCNLDGTNIEEIYRKENLNTHPWAKSNGDTFYIEYYKKNALDASGKTIDSFNINSGKYESVASGKDCDVNDYIQKQEPMYSCSIIEPETGDDYFEIMDIKTGSAKIVDTEFINKTIYCEAMNEFSYYPCRADVSNGHILLTYRIGAGDGWTYSHLIFEFVFDEGSLEYKSLVFPYDAEGVKIEYIS